MHLCPSPVPILPPCGSPDPLPPSAIRHPPSAISPTHLGGLMPFWRTAPNQAAGLTETCMVALGWRFRPRSGWAPPMSSCAGDNRDILPVLDGVTKGQGIGRRLATIRLPPSSLAKQFVTNLLDRFRYPVIGVLVPLPGTIRCQCFLSSTRNLPFCRGRQVLTWPMIPRLL